MKGLATETIVLIVLGLLVLAIVGALIFLGVGPFRSSINFEGCRSRYIAYCNGFGDILSFQGNGDCAKQFEGKKAFCTETSNSACKPNPSCTSPPDNINCCSVLGT